MTNPRSTRTAIATIAGLTLIGALAGCTATSASADAQPGTTSRAGTSGAGTASDTTSSPSSNATGSATGSSSYKDGTYSERGTYQSPGGVELINVKLTLKNDIVTAVTVKTIKADPTAHEYEELFENGIAKVVVGKKIDSLNVSRVAGSSLTSQGFNDAIAAIKTDAKS